MEGSNWAKGGWERTLGCGGSLHSRGAICTCLSLDFWYIVLSRPVLLAPVLEYYIFVPTNIFQVRLIPSYRLR